MPDAAGPGFPIFFTPGPLSGYILNIDSIEETGKT
jgi:hypothetical protein